jgi:protein-tyrosine phosphatase
MNPCRFGSRTLCIIVLLTSLSLMGGASIALSQTATVHNSTIDAKPGQSFGIASVPNLRDLGGYKTKSGATVEKGLVYRSNQLSGISRDDMKKLSKLGLKETFDLRTWAERSARPDELPSGTRFVWVDVLADSPQAGPAQLEKLMQDPKKANAELGGGKVEALFQASYREFVSLPSAKTEFRNLFVALGDKSQLPALFHCTTGKDRTGWAAAALLTLLGVPKDKVYEDYLRSNDYIIPAYQKVIDGFVKAGGDSSNPEAILGVKKEYLDAPSTRWKRSTAPSRSISPKGWASMPRSSKPFGIFISLGTEAA